MAKNVTLTVKVDDAQFTQFMKNFNTFSDRIKTLNTQFQQINTTISKATASSNALAASLRAVAQVAKSMLSSVASITGHFVKWSAIIGGVTALLGMGGGLFGIERLASAIMQRRRQVLGLGGTYGELQAAQIGGRPMFGGGTGNILQNIRSGLGGSQEELRPLLAMGIPFGTRKSPEEVLNIILKKIPDLLRNAPKGTELTVLKAYGLDKIFSTADLLRLTNEEAREEIANRQKFITEHKKELELSKPAQKAWTDLSQQLELAGAHIKNVFGERLAKLAGPLSRLSEAFTKAFDALMKTTLIEKIIRTLTTWMDKFSKYVEKGDFEKDLKEFTDTVESWLPTLKQLESGMKTFAEVLGDVVRVLRFIWNTVKFLDKVEAAVQGATRAPHSQTGAPPGTPNPSMGRSPTTSTTTSPTTSPTTTSPPATPPGTSRQLFGGKAPSNAWPMPAPGAGGAPSSLTPGLGVRPGMPGMPGGIFGGGTSFNNRFGGAGGGSWWNNTVNPNSSNAFNMSSTGGRGGSSFASSSSRMGGGNTSISGGSTNIASWSSAAGRSAPGGTNVNASSRFASNVTGSRGQGPLSASNWQSTRTANLTIRNVPGANVYMAGAGMSA